MKSYRGIRKGSRSIWSLFSAKTFLYYKKDKQLVKFDTFDFLLKLQNEDGELTWVASVSSSRLVLCQFIKCLTQTQSHDNQTRLITLQAAQGKVWTLSAKMLLVSPLRQESGKNGEWVHKQDSFEPLPASSLGDGAVISSYSSGLDQLDPAWTQATVG